MIIALSGPMGSGKSKAVQVLQLTAPAGTRIKLVKFAQPLYDMQEMLYRRIDSVYKRPETFVKDRKLLQWLGSEWIRDSLSSTLLVDLWKKEVLKSVENGCVVVCDDCRFDNEAETIRSMGGSIIKIKADFASARADSPHGLSNHTSEAGVDQKYVNYTVENNSTLSRYESALKSVFEKILPPIKVQK